MSLYDTHCHLNLPDQFHDPAPHIARAREAGVAYLNLVALDLESARAAVEMAAGLENCFAIVGRHPNYAADYDPSELDIFRSLLELRECVAMGELGLDYHWDFATKDQQMACLIDQLDLAADLGKPVVFHCREAYGDLLDLLEKRPPQPYLMHCFSGTLADAKRAIELGCSFGIDGPVTYKKADELRQIVAELPTGRIVLETDSPYMSPVPYRGKPNEPSYLPLINAAVAKTIGLTAEACADLTTKNACAFFRIP